METSSLPFYISTGSPLNLLRVHVFSEVLSIGYVLVAMIITHTQPYLYDGCSQPLSIYFLFYKGLSEWIQNISITEMQLWSFICLS